MSELSELEEEAPKIVVKPPGLKSKRIVKRELMHLAPGYSGAYEKIALVAEEARGSTVKDVDGNVYIDFTAGVSVVNIGHSHPKLVQAVKAEVERLQNVYALTMPTRQKALEKLISILPEGVNRVFFLSGGAEAIEHAIKLAKAATKKFEFISFFGGFHGKSSGAISASCLAGGKRGFGPLLPGFLHAPYAYCYRCSFGLTHPDCGLKCLQYLDELLTFASTGNLAGVIVEPVQGASGCVIPPKGFITGIKELCERNQALMIVDEIFTGFGRTGKLWGIEHYGITPDIMALGKGLGSGIPISAVAAREEIMKTQLWSRPYVYSTTFGGNPISCAAALASMEVLLEERLHENAAKLGQYLTKRLDEMRSHHKLIGNVQSIGLHGGVELVRDQKTKKPASEETALTVKKALEKGLLVIPGGSWDQVVRITPPLCITKELLERGLNILEESISEVEHGL